MNRIGSLFIDKEISTEYLRKAKSQIFDYVALNKRFVYYHSLDLDVQMVRLVNGDKSEATMQALNNSKDLRAAIEAFIDAHAHPEDKKRVKEMLNPDYYLEALKTKKREGIYYRWKMSDGTYSYNRLELYKLEDKSQPPRTVIIGCENMDNEFRQHIENKDFKISLFEGLTLEYSSVWLVRPDRKIELYKVPSVPAGVKNNAKELDGLDMDEAFKIYCQDCVAEEDRERILKSCTYDNLINRANVNSPYTEVFKRVDKYGRERYLQINICKVKSPGGEPDLVVGFKDVDQMVRFQISQQEKLASVVKERDYDVLTGLKNRLCYENAIQEYTYSNKETISCIYVDLDGLHEVNNHEGHDAGDMMLITIANYIKLTWGEDNSFRIGGDEFVIFTFDKEEESLKQEIEEFHYNVMKAGYSVSLGEATARVKDLRIKNLIRLAESEMFRVKKEHYSGSLDRRKPN